MGPVTSTTQHFSADAPRRGVNPYGALLNGFEVSQDGVLRFGTAQVPLNRVAAYAPVHERQQDLDSVLVTVAVFVSIAAILLVLVVELGWRERFLVGSLLLASIGIAAIIDLARTMRLDLYRLEIKMADGQTVMYVTPDRDMLDRMMLALEQRTGKAPTAVA
ncbi:MAG: hypothetical protein RL291_373 [Pseudomonadota bacterium]